MGDAEGFIGAITTGVVTLGALAVYLLRVAKSEADHEATREEARYWAAEYRKAYFVNAALVTENAELRAMLRGAGIEPPPIQPPPAALDLEAGTDAE